MAGRGRGGVNPSPEDGFSITRDLNALRPKASADFQIVGPRWPISDGLKPGFGFRKFRSMFWYTQTSTNHHFLNFDISGICFFEG